MNNDIDIYIFSLTNITEEVRKRPLCSDVGETTIRKYAKNYPDFFKGRRLDGERWAKFPSVTIDIVEKIYLSHKQGDSRAIVREKIYGEFGEELGQFVDEINAEDLVSATTPRRDYSSPTTTLLPPDEFLEMHNANLVHSAMFSLEHYRQLLQIKDEELATTIKQHQADIHNRETTIDELKTELEAKNKTIEELQAKTPRKKK